MRHDFPANDRVSLSIEEGGVAQVRLTRADKMNALDPAMFEALLAVGQALHAGRQPPAGGRHRAGAAGGSARYRNR